MELSDPVIGLVGDPVPSEARWCEATVGGIRIASVYTPHGRALTAPSSRASSPSSTPPRGGCRS
jgi:exonuclease III